MLALWGCKPHKTNLSPQGKEPPRQTGQDRNKLQGQTGRAERHYHPTPIPTREPPRREMGPRRNKEPLLLAPASQWSRGEANRKEFGNGREARVNQVLKEDRGHDIAAVSISED